MCRQSASTQSPHLRSPRPQPQPLHGTQSQWFSPPSLWLLLSTPMNSGGSLIKKWLHLELDKCSRVDSTYVSESLLLILPPPLLSLPLCKVTHKHISCFWETLSENFQKSRVKRHPLLRERTHIVCSTQYTQLYLEFRHSPAPVEYLPEHQNGGFLNKKNQQRNRKIEGKKMDDRCAWSFLNDRHCVC